MFEVHLHHICRKHTVCDKLVSLLQLQRKLASNNVAKECQHNSRSAERMNMYVFMAAAEGAADRKQGPWNGNEKLQAASRKNLGTGV